MPDLSKGARVALSVLRVRTPHTPVSVRRARPKVFRDRFVAAEALHDLWAAGLATRMIPERGSGHPRYLLTPKTDA